MLVRALHVLGAAVVVGGAALVWGFAASADADESRAAILIAERYEWASWVALAAIVASGIGNLAAIGEAVPNADTRWGGTLVVKLLFVAAFLIFSSIRTFAVIGLRNAALPRDLDPLRLLYGTTVAFAATVLILAVVLAHG